MMAPLPGGMVLYVLGAYPVPSETFIRREISALRAAGLPVEIFCLRDKKGAIPAHLHIRGGETGVAMDVVRAPLGGLTANPQLAWQLAREGWRAARRRRDRLYALAAASRVAWAARHFRGRGISRVHAHFATVPGLAGRQLARELGVPFSFTAHAYDLFTARSLFAVLAPAAEFIVVPAEYHRDWIRQHHGAAAADKVQVVRCGIPDHWLRYARSNPDTNNSVVGIGRLVPKKGFDLFVQALAQLPETRWQLIGQGPAYKRLWQLAAFDRLRLARFMPWLDEQYLRFAQATGIGVFPCRVLPDGDRDGLPVTLLEAMALGAPVVATPVAGIPEAVAHGVNGWLVPENDVVALTEALRTLLADRELRDRLGAAARETVRQRFLQSQSTRELMRLFGAGARAVPAASPARARPLRVLRVINNLACGGAQRLLLQWAKECDRARYHTVVAAFAGGPLADELAAAGVTVHILPRRGRYDASLIGRLAKLLRAEKIELVHAQLFAAKLWARLAARRAGVPCVVSEHAIHPRTRRGLYPLVERRLARGTAGWTVDYPGLADYVAGRYGAPRERITVITPGVEYARLPARRSRAEIRAGLGVPEEAIMALGLGRLAEQKGFRELFAMAGAMPDNGGRLPAGALRIVVSGDGPLRAELLALGARPEMDGRVRVVGADWPVGELLAAADVLVLPSQWEGLPLAVLEAAAVGLPVVACDLPGLHALAGEWAGLTLVQDARRIFTELLSLAARAKLAGWRPGRVPLRVDDAAQYAGKLADWYDGIIALRA